MALTGNGPTSLCPHCGSAHAAVCPRIRSVEYYPDGAVRRVEYHPEPDGEGTRTARDGGLSDEIHKAIIHTTIW